MRKITEFNVTVSNSAIMSAVKSLWNICDHTNRMVMLKWARENWNA